MGALSFSNYEQIKKYLDVPIIYLSGCDPTRQLLWINKLEKNNYGGMIACDVFEQYCIEKAEESTEVLKRSDIVFLNEREKQLLEYNPIVNSKISIIKKGERGAELFDEKGDIISIVPSSKCVAIDTNGAGDILAASFLSKVLSGHSYSSALQFSVDLASLSVTK